MPNRLIDMTGKRFGKLIVLRRDESKKTKGAHWVCVCDCGNQKSIDGSRLRNGNTKACGCQRGKCNPKMNKYASYKRLYKIWHHMHNRCKNPQHISYGNYGANGIKVCEAWNNFDSFAEWALESGYEDKLEIDRIEVTGDYEPCNCRWVTKASNARNKRNTTKLKVGKQMLTYGEIAEIMGVSTKLAWQRINRNKYDLGLLVASKDGV